MFLCAGSASSLVTPKNIARLNYVSPSNTAGLTPLLFFLACFFFHSFSDLQQNRLAKFLARTYGVMSKTYFVPDWINSVQFPHQSALAMAKLQSITISNTQFISLPGSCVAPVPSSLINTVSLRTYLAMPMSLRHKHFLPHDFLSLLLGNASLHSKYGKTMCDQDILKVFASFPEVAPPAPTFSIQHPIDRDIYIHESLAVPTSSGWKFKAGQVYEAHKDTWLAISESERVRSVLTSGWCPTQNCDLAPVWFKSNELQPEEQVAWDKEVQDLWAMKAICPIDWHWISKWGPPRIILPVFLVKEPTKYRPIMDARYSNVALKADWFPCPSILDFCQTLTKDRFWFKCDQKSGWQHINLHPSHSRFFCFQWRRLVFAYTTPAFGDTTAPFIFTYMGATFKRALKAKGFQFILYIDDLLVAGKHSFQDTLVLREKVIQLAMSLGIVFAVPKCPPPSLEGEALGFLVDTAKGILGISPKRKLKIQTLLQECLDNAIANTLTPLKKVARLVGLIISCQVLHPQTMWFVAPLIHLFTTDWECSISTTPSQFARVFPWLQLVSSSPRRLWIDPPCHRFISTDATLSQLGAALWKSNPSFLVPGVPSTPQASAAIRPFQQAHNIAHFEAVAIPWALKTFIDFLPNYSHITWAVDNQNVFYGFKNGFARMPYIAAELNTFMNLVIKHSLWVEFVWVPSAINLEADVLSRDFSPMHEIQLHHTHWENFLKFCVEQDWPLPNFDAFASAQNAKFKVYFSKIRDGQAVGNFWFSELSHNNIYWVFPPLGKMIPAVLKRIQQHEARAWVLLPQWTSRPWWHITSQAIHKYTLSNLDNVSPFVTISPDNKASAKTFNYPLDIWFFDFRTNKVA